MREKARDSARALKSPLVDERKRREKERKKIKQRIEQRSSNKRASIEETRPRIIKKTVMLLDTCRSVTKKRDDKSENGRKGEETKKSTGNGTTVKETTAAKIGRERERRKRKEKWELKIEGKKALSRARDKGRGVRGWG